MTTDRQYYVYYHVCPTTKVIMYVGKGKHGRAWDVTRSRGTNKAHQDWMIGLSESGYIPEDWVVIAEKGLTEEEALELERNTLHNIGRTQFNMQGGERNHQSKLTDSQAIDIFKRARDGENHTKLAVEFGVSRTAVSMIAARKQWKTVTAGV